MHGAAIETPSFGKVWCVEQLWNDLPSLTEEVEEYFQLGLELRPGDTVVDVGANIGMFSLAAAKRVPGIRIIAFEPIPQIFDLLERNFRENPILAETQGSRLFCLALGRVEDEGLHDFYLFKRFPTNSTRYVEEKRREMIQSVEYFAERMKPWISPLPRIIERLRGMRFGQWLVDSVTGVTRVRCGVSSLSRIIDGIGLERVDLLKIDVEGAELDVVLGIREEHWARIRQVMLEGHDIDGRLTAIRRLLERRGFGRFRQAEPAETRERGLTNFLLLASREEASVPVVSAGAA